MPTWEDVVELGELLDEAWRVFAAKRAIKAWDALTVLRCSV